MGAPRQAQAARVPAEDQPLVPIIDRLCDRMEAAIEEATREMYAIGRGDFADRLPALLRAVPQAPPEEVRLEYRWGHERGTARAWHRYSFIPGMKRGYAWGCGADADLSALDFDAPADAPRCGHCLREETQHGEVAS